MNDVYTNLPKLKIEMTPAKFIAIIATILLSFVLPATISNSYQNNLNNTVAINNSSSKTAQVAGLSTTKNDSTILNINLNDQSQMLILVGGIIVTISLLIIIFLLVDNFLIKKNG